MGCWQGEAQHLTGTEGRVIALLVFFLVVVTWRGVEAVLFLSVTDAFSAACVCLLRLWDVDE